MNDAHRKARLRHLIKTDYGDRKAFMEATGVSKGRLSQMLGKEPFGEKAAKNLQEELGLPVGWFSLNEPTPKELARKPAAASQSSHTDGNAAQLSSHKWPLTLEVMAALAALDGEGRRKAENVLRSHLDLPPMPRAADPADHVATVNPTYQNTLDAEVREAEERKLNEQKHGRQPPKTGTA